MKRSLLLLLSLIVAGCAGTSTTTTPQSVSASELPANVKLNGVALGDGLRAGEYVVWLTSAAEPKRGAAQLEALVLDKDNQPVTDAAVSFDIDMTNMSHGKNVVKTTAAGDGHYAGDVHFMMGGPWRVIVTIERANQTPVNARFNFNVR